MNKADPRPLEKTDAVPKFTVGDKNSFLTKLRVLILNMTVIVLVPNLGFFVLLQNFELDELDGSDFKYDKIIFKFLTQKYAIKTFLEPNLRTFIFAPNFETGQIRGR